MAKLSACMLGNAPAAHCRGPLVKGGCQPKADWGILPVARDKGDDGENLPTIPCVRDRIFLAIRGKLTYNFKAVPPVGDLPMGGDGISAVPRVLRKDGQQVGDDAQAPIPFRSYTGRLAPR